MTPTTETNAAATAQDFLPLLGTDYVEFYVGNARQSAHFYESQFGFRLAAFKGPETGVRDRVSYVVAQNKIRFVFTAALRPEHEIAAHVQLHGDGVHDIALWVDDAAAAWRETTRRGARSVREPERRSDENGAACIASVAIYGDTIHTFVERKDYRGAFLPGYVAVSQNQVSQNQAGPTAGLLHIDHMVGNVALGEMQTWVDFYRDVMGFRQFQSFDDKDISTEYSALMSKVVASSNERIKFPLNEPAAGKRKSQIDEYLDFYRGAGVQHIAMEAADIIATVSSLKSRGVEFLTVPSTYYDHLPERVGPIAEPVARLAELGILADRDDEGYMLQIFTRPVGDRPTLFYEIIQRKGSRGFGKGNFKALFEAIEREQARRGNL
jgi:4-hydroxyphenylpyruvate dioxygenase